ncbi:hypothetical protein M9H77_18362 [Catharanthus roseus]|uniref:Uncharacterized protein n=1 Tax=Catharanthus roseus TaxID=4058 RepID=A0ACC0B781_CATRO|nr:hypothetical protein M9H77_18362 [Catharanthus roseus]
MISSNISVARFGARGHHRWIGCFGWKISFKNCQRRSLFRLAYKITRNILTKSELPTKSIRIIGLYFVNIMLAKTGVAKANLKEEHSNKSCQRCNEQREGRTCWNLICCHESKTSAVVLAKSIWTT